MDLTFHSETQLTKTVKKLYKKLRSDQRSKGGGGRAIAPEYATVFIYRIVSRGNKCTKSLTLYRNSSDECPQLATVRGSILITTPEGRTIDSTR